MMLGQFIQPDPELASLDEPNSKLGIPVYSGHRAVTSAAALLGESSIFDSIWQKWKQNRLTCEDQCSAQYYFDIVRTLRDFNGEFDHVVEVGVYMGGSTSILAGCMDRFDYSLDLVDIDASFLRYAHERARRMYPEAAGRIRLFHGDLAAYVRHVMMTEKPRKTVVHHDGAHDFNQVVRDLSALSFVRDQLYAVIAQDTHLRGTPELMNFVDMALYAVFGHDLNYVPIGQHYGEGHPCLLPNQYQGNYFMQDAAEGFVLPMYCNEFKYPHPSLSMDMFLPPARDEVNQADRVDQAA